MCFDITITRFLDPASLGSITLMLGQVLLTGITVEMLAWSFSTCQKLIMKSIKGIALLNLLLRE